MSCLLYFTLLVEFARWSNDASQSLSLHDASVSLLVMVVVVVVIVVVAAAAAQGSYRTGKS